MSDRHDSPNRPAHTPGPWHWERSGVLCDENREPLFTAIYEPIKNEDNRYSIMKREEADQTLIAAAPALLEALEGLDRAASESFASNPLQERLRIAILDARKALAKAKGETA